MKKIIAILFLLCILVSLAGGDSGMWLPHQIEALNLKSEGLELDPATLFKEDGTGLMSAVVYLGGGTGEFVSPEGLILTNHHVAFGAIQRASTEESDYISKGFLAKTREEEIPAHGYIADVLIKYEEVTAQIETAVSDEMDYLEKYKAIEKVEKELIAVAEQTGPDIRARIQSMYEGNVYYLFYFKRLRDIRIAYAPPKDLGNFGGDIDNWMWPRHTCDFAILRAYVSEENEGKPYSKENVPYKPKSIIPISTFGVKAGDFSFVMGYPGRTYRNDTVYEVEFDMDRMAKSIENFEDIIHFFEEKSAENKATEIKYAGKIKGLNNAVKNYKGKLEGMQKADLLQRKKEMQADFIGWTKRQNEKDYNYQQNLQNISAFVERYSDYYWKNQSITTLTSSYFGPSLLAQAHTIYRTAKELQKPNMERESGFQDRNLPYLRQRIELAERGYDLETDKAFFKFILNNLEQQPPSQHPRALADLLKQKKAGRNAFVDSLYRNTVLDNVEKRLQLLDESPEALIELNDPMLELAAELETELGKLREKSKALSQERKELKKIYLHGLLQKNDHQLAPDANGTLRLTFGEVKGYSPRDAVYYKPVTTLSGVIEKDKGEEPFNVPEKLKKLYQERNFGAYRDDHLDDVPVCFLNTTCVTGGNSGSPTLNAKGELVGIIFDMTYESVIGDYYIIPEFQRTISVDIRYVLFIVDKFAGASHLLKELGM
ncbi:hypothetical protein GF407_04200 [candidate division KSB1 bacterium]|nr:hypothetical protein [candidate division KSB1 bacterium]